MDVTGRVAVVTGGASGAGRAIALGLAARGAAGIVISDIDADGAANVAAEVARAGGRAQAIRTDVTREEDVRYLVTRCERAFGPPSMIFSNAGIIVPGGPEAADEAWSRIWAVNVHSHVYVARAVLPGMLARGEGYLVITASAAGLLTQLGSAPYAVTKHAAVALAEWLSITYGDRGIRVSCLCPQAFSSNLLATSVRELSGVPLAGSGGGGPPDGSGSEGPPDGSGSAGPPDGTGESLAGNAAGGSAQAAIDGVLTAEQVAEATLDAVGAEQFLILPHPEVATYERRRADDRERWLRGMRRMQARLAGEP
ncbi:MAG: SDR family NAD(P)-dependent oxidoreductase [Actinobacteria bacterium]|nr:SDR family NAD(P)-dependent oxidoreductase [Actinomycetota bacterium]